MSAAFPFFATTALSRKVYFAHKLDYFKYSVNICMSTKLLTQNSINMRAEKLIAFVSPISDNPRKRDLDKRYSDCTEAKIIFSPIAVVR